LDKHIYTYIHTYRNTLSNMSIVSKSKELLPLRRSSRKRKAPPVYVPDTDGMLSASEDENLSDDEGITFTNGAKRSKIIVVKSKASIESDDKWIPIESDKDKEDTFSEEEWEPSSEIEISDDDDGKYSGSDGDTIDAEVECCDLSELE
jgi:hypothetical protein